MFKWNYPYFSLCPLHLVIFLDTSKRNVAPFFSLLHQVLICMIRCMGTFCLGWTVPALLLLWQILQSVNSQTMSVVSVILGSQALYPVFQMCLTSVRGRITFLGLVVVLFVMQSRILLAFLAPRTHFWLMFNLLPTRTLCKAAFQRVRSQSFLVYGVLPPQVQDLTSSCTELVEVPVGHFSSPGLSEQWHGPVACCVSATHPKFLSSAS